MAGQRPSHALASAAPMGRLLLLAIVGVVAAIADAADAATGCSTAEVARRGAEVRQARSSLTAIRLEEMQTEVTPVARQAIEAVKDRIVAFVSEAVRCAPANVEPDSLQRELAERGDGFEDRQHYDEYHLP